MAKKEPEHIKVNDDGSVTVTLSRPIDINGAKLSYLTMREPTVGDQLVSSAVRGTVEEKEITLFSNLCTVAPSDIHKLPMRDYMRLQAAFGNFLD
jgi:hypothetical protein